MDCSKLVQYFTLNKYQIANEPQVADYIIFVTCSFRKEREEECWEYINEFKQYKGELIILGCLPEIAPIKFNQEFKGRYLSTKDLYKIDIFFDKFKIKFSNIPDDGSIYSNPKKATQKFSPNIIERLIQTIRKCVRTQNKKTAYLRISHGCMENCSYCSITKAIGKLTSKSIKTCIEEYKGFLGKGFRKFIILSDNTGAYGLDIKSSFGELLGSLSVASGQHNVSWHLEQIHPRWVLRYQAEMLEMVKARKIRKISCALQSGSNRILKLMNRHHTVEEIADVLLRFKKYNPNLRLGTEIILGFPSETEVDFFATLDIIRKIQFDSVFLYPYYDGYGTIASKLDNKIGPEIIEGRVRIAWDFLNWEGMIKADDDW